MTSSHNGHLVDAWRGQPAPLLPLLHAYHDRDRFLSDAAIREVAEGLEIPLAELFGTVTFYHHFARSRPGQAAPRVCTGPVCCLRGSGDLVESLDGALDALAAEGIEPPGGVGGERWKRNFFLSPRDTNGVLFQLFEEPPG